MLRGMVTSMQGMLAQQRRQELVAQNLANLETEGYRRQRAVYTAFPRELLQRLEAVGSSEEGQLNPIGTITWNTMVQSVVTVHQTGPWDETGSALNVALGGVSDWFVLENQGEQVYSRRGNFEISNDGYLVDQFGNYVLGTKGRIPVDVPGSEIQIDSQGNLISGGRTLGQLLIRHVNDPQVELQQDGNGLFHALPGAQPVDATEVIVQQGFLERSNVDPVQEIIESLAAMRSYQASQKVLTMEDEALGRAVNEIGKLR